LATCEALTDLFERHGYENSVIFGHAKDGNIHFMLNERFQEPANLERYQRFTEDMVDLILDNGGSLKAEHGTGRIMAPFVRRQYGDELYEVMKEVKRLCDPTGMLNPGVVLSDDPTSYVRDLKLVPPVEDEVDRCVECGFCEPGCPSKDVTMTPRQRIVVRREMAKAEATGDFALLAELRKDYGYDGIDTCAVDGMCQLACPVNINTADLVRRLRNENTGAVEQSVWKTASRHWGTIARVSGVALTVAEATPAAIVNGATRLGRAVLGADRVPLYGADLPQGGRQRRPRSTADPVAVYFPACIGTMFGPANNGQGVSDAFLALCRQAQVAGGGSRWHRRILLWHTMEIQGLHIGIRAHHRHRSASPVGRQPGRRATRRLRRLKLHRRPRNDERACCQSRRPPRAVAIRGRGRVHPRPRPRWARDQDANTFNRPPPHLFLHPARYQREDGHDRQSDLAAGLRAD